jgi:hypothetical protein
MVARESPNWASGIQQLHLRSKLTEKDSFRLIFASFFE